MERGAGPRDNAEPYQRHASLQSKQLRWVRRGSELCSGFSPSSQVRMCPKATERCWAGLATSEPSQEDIRERKGIKGGLKKRKGRRKERGGECEWRREEERDVIERWESRKRKKEGRRGGVEGRKKRKQEGKKQRREGGREMVENKTKAKFFLSLVKMSRGQRTWLFHKTSLQVSSGSANLTRSNPFRYP